VGVARYAPATCPHIYGPNTHFQTFKRNFIACFGVCLFITLIGDRAMPAPSYEEIRKRIETRYNRIFWLIAHVIMAFVTTAVVWAIDPTPQDGTPVLAVLWIGILICHAVKVGMDELKDRAIERTWQRYERDLDAEMMEDKPKRSITRLMDNTEVEVIEEEPIYESNGKGHRSVNR
jgi:hypothetical protein